MALLNYLADSFRRNKIVAVILLISVAACAGVYYDRIDVDNLRLDGNTISSTNTNGDITLDPNGSGGVAFTDLTATTVPYLDSNKELTSSAVTPTELGYVSGVTSAIQTQLDAKLDDFTGSTDNVIVRTDGTGGDTVQESGVSIDDSDVVSGITQLNVDNIRIDGNTISSTDTNGTITLTPDGSGVVDFSSTINVLTQGELRLQDSSGGEYMGFKAPSTVTSSTSFTLPDGDGSSGQFLSTNGSATLSWATAGTALNVSTQTASSFSASTGYLYKIDTSSNSVTANLPAASGATGDLIIFKIIDATNTFTMDGNTTETIDGSTTFDLLTDNEAIAIRSDGSNWHIVGHYLAPRSEVFVDTCNGHGSTGTKVRVFTQTRKNSGSAITYTSDTTNGDYFTINEDGVYAIYYSDYYTSGATFIAVTVNASSLVTSANGLTYANGRRHGVNTPAGSLASVASWTGNLSASDVVRAMDAGVSDSADAFCSFSIVQLSK